MLSTSKSQGEETARERMFAIRAPFSMLCRVKILGGKATGKTAGYYCTRPCTLLVPSA